MNTNTTVSNRALLVWLNVRTWSARKLDKKVSAQVNRDHNASSKASRTNKSLMHDTARSYHALITLCGAIRSEHYKHTLAWSDEGWRVLSTANYIAYTDWLRGRQADFDRLFADFLADYPTLRLDAQTSLGSLYNAADYPDVSDIRSKFSINLSYMPLPMEGDIRVDLAADQVAAIESDIAAKSNASLGNAMRDAWERLHDVVKHVADKLSDPSAIFRDSLIENTRELCDVLQRLNITDDPNLEAMRSAVATTIANMQPDTLRVSKHARQTTADNAQAILDKMAAFYQTS